MAAPAEARPAGKGGASGAGAALCRPPICWLWKSAREEKDLQERTEANASPGSGSLWGIDAEGETSGSSSLCDSSKCGSTKDTLGFLPCLLAVGGLGGELVPGLGACCSGRRRVLLWMPVLNSSHPPNDLIDCMDAAGWGVAPSQASADDWERPIGPECLESWAESLSCGVSVSKASRSWICLLGPGALRLTFDVTVGPACERRDNL